MSLPLDVCVDGRIAAQHGGTGVSTYATALAAAIGAAGHRCQVLVEGTRQPTRAGRWLSAAVSPRPWPATLDQTGRRRIGDAFRIAQVRFDVHGRYLRLRDRQAPPAIMHWTYPLPMRFCGVPNIYTVHDLIPLLHPALTGIAQPRMRRLLARLQREAACLVTVSEASRRDIIRELGWPPERVVNTYQAVLHAAPPRPAVAEVLGGLGLDHDGYILHAGTVEPRKNVRRLIEAYRASGLTTPLVIAGPDGWHAAAETGGLAGVPGVIRLPWVERGTMLALLSGARFVTALSLAEGFGLVLAEGMAFGTPVLTSTAPAMAEVAGDAALIVDPYDVGAIADALRRLDRDAGLRAALRARGLQRARLFTMEAYAGRLRALYREIMVGSLAPSSRVACEVP